MISGWLLCGLLAITAACDQPAKPTAAEIAADSAVVRQRAARLASALAHPDQVSPDTPLARWNLPRSLNEISGLALTADGRLLTHGDERGKVFEVDYRRGVVVKEFTVGSPTVHGDFESITVVGNDVLLMTSSGTIYRFPEGANGAAVQYTVRDTGLGDECEFEGLAYESSTHALLLACKRAHNRALRDSVVIFRVPLEPEAATTRRPAAHVAIAVSTLIGSNDWDGFHPSDLTINPFNGNYVLVASRERAIAEITPAGTVVFARPLPAGHDQAEGVAITKDHLLIVSDEAKGGPALITLYRWKP